MFKNVMKAALGLSTFYLTLGVSSILVEPDFSLVPTAAAETTLGGRKCKREARRGDRPGSILFQKDDGTWIRLTGWKYYNRCSVGGTFNGEDGITSIPVEAQKITAPAGGFTTSAVKPPIKCPANTLAQPNGTCLANSAFTFRSPASFKVQPIQNLAPRKATK